MKILQLRFKNLNSLAGEWEIDFTAPEYVSDGIFAISGPTGAGKSTILDAICLALYGRTPRLKSISIGSNEIMSRQTWECFAEVLFETQSGKFRCTWSQRRAFKKADGNLSAPNHEIADGVTGEILESKKARTALAIEERTGMDFDRFTQSMLLAQGEFTAFLQAAPDERAPILEQITGTEIYSTISKQVFDRMRTERSRLELLQTETLGIEILSDEEEALRTEELTEKQAGESILMEQKNNLEQSLLWINGIIALRLDLENISAEELAHADSIRAFEPDRSILVNSVKAAEFDGQYATLLATRKQQKEDIENLTASEKLLPDLSEKSSLADIKLTASTVALNKIKGELETERIIIRQVREADLLIRAKRDALQAAERDRKNLEFQLSEKNRIRKDSENQANEARVRISEHEMYLCDHASDANLVSELTGITELVRNLSTATQESAELAVSAEKAETRHKADLNKYHSQELLCKDLKSRLEASKLTVSQARESIQELLGPRLLREYRADADRYLQEMAYLNKIVSLEDERTRLEDNKPCPLCGSLHHPFAEGNIPGIHETQAKIDELLILIKAAEEMETGLKGLESAERQAEAELNQANEQLIHYQRKAEEEKTNAERLDQEKKKAAAKCATMNENLISRVRSFGITEIPAEGAATLLTSLSGRLKRWQEHQEQKAIIGRRIDELTSGMHGIDGILITLGESLTGKLNEIAALKAELDQLSAARTDQYGLKNPDAEELRLNTLLQEAEKSETESRSSQQRIRQELETLRIRMSDLQEKTHARMKELKIEEELLNASIREAGFVDEADFIRCRLPKEERDRLNRHAQELDSKQADIQTRKKDRQTRLLGEEARNITDQPLSELTAQLGEVQEALRSLTGSIGALQQKLADNRMNKLRYSQKMLEVEAQKTECRRWDILSHLIGSADGKKYRNFAQGLTFELMVSHANRQLSRLTDRYLLIRDTVQPLDLNVIDNYQAGEIRSARNLSGGESFIVSLALALGLSHMASKKVRVDSLFLDEGFGSLDEDTLETALETLASLRQDGKLIGVISHVSALKERISTKITVRPASGGKSILSGPGVTSH